MKVNSDYTPEMERQCQRAARRFWRYKEYWYGRGYSYEDVLQDARLIAITPRGKKEPETEAQLFCKIYYGLIDKLRSTDKTRSFKRRGERRVCYASWEVLQEYQGGYWSDRALLKSRDLDDGRTIYFVRDSDGLVTNAFDLDDVSEIVREVAKWFDSTTQRCAELRYVFGLKYKEIGFAVDRSISRVSQILSVFKRALKKELLRRSVCHGA